MSRLSTSETSFSLRASIRVVAGVVVEVSSSSTRLHILAVGVVVGGTISRGWRSLRLGRRPWWRLAAEPSIAGSTLLLLLHLALAGFIGCLALGLHHDGGIHQSFQIRVRNGHENTLNLFMKTIKEAVPLLLIGISVLRCISSQGVELVQVVYHTTIVLLKVEELISLDLD
jgi:hypothetical protein